MRLEILEQLEQLREQKQAAVLITCLDNSEQYLFIAEKHDINIPKQWQQLAANAIHHDRSRLHETDNGQIFCQVFNPLLRLFIVGAVHISQHLAPMATMCGYDVTVIDPRQAFASDERFPDITIDCLWPKEALLRLAPDHRTAIVTLSHDPKLDDPALEAALDSNAFYIGALGSQKTQARREKRLTEKGYSKEQQQRICGPVGLNIGAESPAEIAVSIMAELTQALRQYRHVINKNLL